MKLCTAMMFDGNVERFASKIVDLEAAGVDLVLVPEIYGFDQVSVLGYIAAKTARIELMTGIVNVYSRSPALIAQTAATIDALSGGRFTLGIGTSGAQVVEGWHGVPFKRPLGRTRDTVDICRKVWSGDKVVHDADAREGARGHVGFYVGGMGAKSKNYYNDLFRRYGWEEEAEKIQDLFLGGQRAEAMAAVPDEYVDSANLIGTEAHIKERLGVYKDVGVTHLTVNATGANALDDMSAVKAWID